MPKPLAEAFAGLADPRLDRSKRHSLADILAVALCAVIAGADSWEEVERFGRAKVEWLRTFLALPNGVPSHDTFYRLFTRLDPAAFAGCVAGWLAGACEATGLRHVAVDGKAVRASAEGTFSGCLHLVSAWAAEGRVILGQVSVADGSHEIAALPELLRVLDLKGALVTLDAAGCQKAVAAQIRGQGGDYLLAVKGNQPALQRAVHAAFGRARGADFEGVGHDRHEASEDGHGRHEERSVTVVYDPVGRPPAWPDVAAVVEVSREREVKGVNTSTAHYYVTSHRGTAEELGRLVRRHWAVENELHWVLDVAFREDASKTSAGQAGANLGLVRRVAASLIHQDEARGSVKAKRLTAAWDESYLLKLLQGNTEI
jgi:predicted transposase YbfD/YdcC